MNDELLKKLRPLLTSKSPDLSELQSLMLELAEAKAKALQDLYEKRPEMLRPKEKDVTDLDRKTQMEAWTAQKEHDYMLLCDVWEVVLDLIKTGASDGPVQSQPDKG